MGSPPGLLRNKWFVAILVSLLVIIAIETLFLAVLIDGGSIGGQSFPKFSFNPPVANNCSTLSYQIVSQNADNRTVRFDCNTLTMNMSAFRVYAPLNMPSIPENIRGALAEPIFNLPPGYLNLSITPSDINFRCPATAFSSIVSGESYSIDNDIGHYGYDYCAIISNSVSHVDGFRIQWIEGSLSTLAPSPHFDLSLSSSSINIATGHNATVTASATSRYGYRGSLQFSAHMGIWNSSVASPPGIMLNPTQATLLSYGQVQFSLTIRTSTNATKGTFLIFVSVQSPEFYDQVDLYVNVT